jgi:hypothetical protein
VVIAIDINIYMTTSQNEGKIAVTISQLFGLKALHHAAPKVRACNKVIAKRGGQPSFSYL